MAGIFYYDAIYNRLKINFKFFFIERIACLLFKSFFNTISELVRVRSIAPLPSTHFWNPNTRRGSSVGSMSALYANSPNIEPRVRLSWIFPSYAYLRKASCQLLAKRIGTRH